MSKMFYAGQKVRVKPGNDKINEHFFGMIGEVMQNEPSGMFDYYLKFDNEEFAQVCYAFNEEELEAIDDGDYQGDPEEPCTCDTCSLVAPVVLAGNSRLDKLSLTKELVAVVREISDARRSSNLAVAYDVARYILKNYNLTKKDGN